MYKSIRQMVLVSAAMFASVPAQAGLYQDDLTRCVVESANADDRLTLVRWVFAGMSASPKIKDMTAITPARSASLSEQTAMIMQRLLTEQCRNETALAIKYENAGVIQVAFGKLGEVAMSDLMADPLVNAYMSDLGKFLDQSKWDGLAKAAGREP